MTLFDNISMALASLKSAKMRSFLTMLGIIIGIASVIAIMTIGTSLQGSISDSLSSFGITNITFSVSQKSEGDGSQEQDPFADAYDDSGRMFLRDDMQESDLISDDMIAAFQTEFSDSIAGIELTANGGTATIKDHGNKTDVMIYGVNPDYGTMESVKMYTGRFINAQDLDKKRAVCVVSDVFAKNLFGSEDVIGKTIDVEISGYTREMYIVGIYSYENMTTNSDTSDVTTTLYVPVTSLKRWSGDKKGYASIVVQAAGGVDTKSFMSQGQQFFASYYATNDTYTVQASSLEDMLTEMTKIMSQVTLAISAIAAISLIVGGVGVMNIMLVSITERTREIGTRKALGATSSEIRTQFITEAVIICLIGGLIGIILGTILGAIGAGMLGFAVTPDAGAILLSTLFSTGIGVFFGWYPANKAAKMNPIDALRYE